MFVLVHGIVQREIFTFVDDEGVNYNIDSGALRLWCLEQHRQGALEVVHTPVRPDIARKFVEEDRSIDLSHVERLRGTPLDPIIYCIVSVGEDGIPDVMLADGHHRYCLMASEGEEFIPSFMLTREKWEPFRVDLQPMTAEQLRALPVMDRQRR